MTSNSTTDLLPDASTEKILYTLFVCFGLPMNISTFFYMMKRYKHARSFLLLLHINLNLTDILVLGPSSIGKLLWLVTEEWLAGDLACRLMRFIDMFAFMASSNIMVCIALYRLYALRYPLWVSAVGYSRVPRMLFSAWGLAAITSLPQLFLWQEVTIGGKTECVNIWLANAAGWESFLEGDAKKMLIYAVVCSIVVFYIPCAILVICYVLILKDIYATLTYDSDNSSVLYIAELTRLSSCGRSSKEKQQQSQKQQGNGNAVALHPSQSSLRGQDRFQRAKIRSLRITLLLILFYVITWLPYNMLIWVMVYDLKYYWQTLEAKLYFLNCLVYFNSVINPFIYGRCQGLKMLCRWRKGAGKKKSKQFCWILQH